MGRVRRAFWMVGLVVVLCGATLAMPTPAYTTSDTVPAPSGLTLPAASCSTQGSGTSGTATDNDVPSDDHAVAVLIVVADGSGGWATWEQQMAGNAAPAAGEVTALPVNISPHDLALPTERDFCVVAYVAFASGQARS